MKVWVAECENGGVDGEHVAEEGAGISKMSLTEKGVDLLEAATRRAGGQAGCPRRPIKERWGR